jgi:ankyrin repeat protein
VGVLKTCLNAGVSVDERNSFGYTLLMLAALENQEEIVSIWVAKGADINAKFSQ